VNIKTLVYLNSKAANHINVYWKDEDGYDYATAVYLVKKLTSSVEDSICKTFKFHKGSQ